jgi:nicotinamide-nucleotide amidase
MATGAAERLGADYALAVTGFSGETTGCGGNAVGSIYIALHAPHGIWSKKLSYPGPRATVKTRTVNAALDWLRRELLRVNHGAAIPAQRIDGVMQ